MNPATALEKYTSAFNAMKDHQDRNGDIFKEQQRLFLALMDAENELRDAAALALTGAENGQFKVAVTPQTQTFADIDEINRILETGAHICYDDLKTIVKTVPRPPRINITEKGSR